MYIDKEIKEITELSKRLQDIMPAGLSSYFFVPSGLEANNLAIKIAHLYHVNCGDTKRSKVISGQESCHCASDVIRVKGANCKNCNFHQKSDSCNRECLESLRQTIMDIDPSTISCLIMEPLTGPDHSVPPKGYLQKVKAMCYEFGILLIFDETEIGIAKPGFMSMAEYFGVTPDILTISKSITNDIVPLGVCAIKQGIADSFQGKSNNDMIITNHFDGCEKACAAAVKNLNLLEKCK